MRILHTSDWHLGKKLGRYDRAAESREVLAEIGHLADEHRAELVIVSGDVFDRPVPPVEALAMGLDALITLARSRPVVAVAGNHDSPELFTTLAPLLEPLNVHLVGRIDRPDEGGVRRIDTDGGVALVAGFPFLRESRVVDFMAETGEWYGAYADRVASICRAYSQHLGALAGGTAIPILAAHFMVSGVKIDTGAPRGERALHIGDAYAATSQAIPPGPQYVALGHIHAPQKVPGSPVPAEYAGSLLGLDFGEAGERKRVVLVDVEPGIRAKVKSIPLRGGRLLIRATGTWEELLERKDLGDAYVDVAVKLTGPDPDLAERAREAFPFLVKVAPVRDAASIGDERRGRGGRSLDELYVEYYRHAEHGADPPDELVASFRDVLDEVDHAPA
jgi:exonuclease SbcD